MPTGPAPKSQSQNWQRFIDPGLTEAIKLWHVDLHCEPDAPLLSPDEQERAGRFRFAVHRQRFVAARTALRRILGNELRRRPEEIRFRYTPFGKPLLDELHFNLAHSENAGLIGVAAFPIGVDLEINRTVEFDLLASSVFSPSELQLWTRMQQFEKPKAFFALWTRKEALLKGIGCGIAEHVRETSVFFDNSATVQYPTLLDPANWAVQSLDLSPNCSAAVAWRRG